MRNHQEQNGGVKEEKQEGVGEEEIYMAPNFTFAPPFMNVGHAHNQPHPSMNMEDDFINNIWADGPAHNLTNAIGPPAADAAQNGRSNEDWADNEMGDGGPCVDNPEETLEDFLQKAGVLPPPPGPTSNGPTIHPYGPSQVPLQRTGTLPPGPAFQPYRPPIVEMAGRVGRIDNGPTLNGPAVQPPYGPSRVPYPGLQSPQMAGQGPLPEGCDLNSAGVGYGGQTIAAGNTGRVCCPYGGSIAVGAGRVGFGGFTCDHPMEVIGGSGDRGKRPVYEPEEAVAERRTRRKVKNRESAARSRARKHAYVITMEAERDRLQGENSRLRLREQRLLKEKPEEQAGPSTVRRCKSCSW